MRTALVLLALALPACGDDTTTVPPPDLSISCFPPPSDPAHNCCVRQIAATRPCTVVGDYCSAFEESCTCGADLVWACHNPSRPPDLATPLFD